MGHGSKTLINPNCRRAPRKTKPSTAVPTAELGLRQAASPPATINRGAPS
ncbi:MAG: hypothetical protein ACO4AI_10200 [Prochlorothrix sp.]